MGLNNPNICFKLKKGAVGTLTLLTEAAADLARSSRKLAIVNAALIEVTFSAFLKFVDVLRPLIGNEDPIGGRGGVSWKRSMEVIYYVKAERSSSLFDP